MRSGTDQRLRSFFDRPFTVQKDTDEFLMNGKKRLRKSTFHLHSAHLLTKDPDATLATRPGIYTANIEEAAGFASVAVRFMPLAQRCLTRSVC
jgi:hypothetical protein